MHPNGFRINFSLQLPILTQEIGSLRVILQLLLQSLQILGETVEVLVGLLCGGEVGGSSGSAGERCQLDRRLIGKSTKR